MRLSTFYKKSLYSHWRFTEKAGASCLSAAHSSGDDDGVGAGSGGDVGDKKTSLVIATRS